MLNHDIQKKPPLFRVQDITRNIRHFLETQFSKIGIQGEISSFTQHPSGHWYFTLKDSHSQIQGVMFRYTNQKMTFTPKVGEELIVWGKITVYEPRGSYQILSDRMEKAGDGVLQKSFEELKEKLKKEGLFERKQPLPYLPQHIAVVTSESGAALQDVLNVLRRRCKGIAVTVVPALMEGKQASASVMQALQQAWKLKNLDLVLITRGGGSAESLWSFNDEALARLAFESPVPLVSAIGHEIDFTIMDFVADLRAPTPSSAAELISKNGLELVERIHNWRQSLTHSFLKMLTYWQKEVHQYKKTLASPISRIEDFILKCDDNLLRLKQGVTRILETKAQQLKLSEQALHQLNPAQVMKRGYSLCFKDGRVVRESSQLHSGSAIQIQFFKGRAKAQVTQTFKET